MPLDLSQFKPVAATPPATTPKKPVPQKTGKLDLSQFKPLDLSTFKKVGDSSVSDYANKSANPAVTDNNPTPNWFQKVIAGTPLAPVDESDTKYDESTSWTKPLVTTGKMLANVFSDSVGILAAIPQAIIHPINTVTGLASAVGNVTKETKDAIDTGIKTGDWSQLGNDVQDTEVSIQNHPLQTVLLMDEALKSSKATISAVADKGPLGAIQDAAADTVKKGKQYISDIDNARKNIAAAFTTKSTINNHLANIQTILSDKIGAMKTVDDLKQKLDSFTQKSKDQISSGEKSSAQNIADQQKAQNDLHTAQAQLDDLTKQHDETTKKMAADQKKEMDIKGFPSVSEAGDAIKKLATTAKDRFSNIYDQTLGKAKVDLQPVFSGFDKLKSYLTSISDTETNKALSPKVDNLRLRDMVSKYGDDTQKLYTELSKSNIDPKLYQHLTEEQLKSQFPPLTSDTVKGTISNIEKVIRDNNPDALKKFSEFVKSGTQDNPAGFKKAFQDAVRNNFGQDRLNSINENDKNWSEMLSSDLLQKDNPTLNDISNGWKDFNKFASKLPEGKELITKLQNYVGSQILDTAESGGEYSANKIQTGLKKFGSMLDDTTKNRLTAVAESLRDTSEVDSKKQEVSDIKNIQKDLSSKQTDIAKQQAKILADSKVVGNDSADVEKNVMKIDSMEKLQNFLEKSGKTIKELTPVIVHALIEQSDKEAGKPSDANYDLNRIDTFIKKIDSLGGGTSGGQEVNNALLGQEGDTPSKFQDAFNELKKQNEKYKLLEKTGKKTMAGRLAKAAFGAFLAVGGLGFGRFKGISDIRSAFSSGVTEPEPSGRERAPIDNGSKTANTKLKIKKIATVGSVAKVGQDNQNDN